MSADPRPRYRRFPSSREPRRERTRRSGGKEEQKGRPDEGIVPANTHRHSRRSTARRGEAPRHPKTPRILPKPTAPAPPSEPWQSRARRQTEPPTRLDRKHDRHTRTTGGQLATHLLPIGGLSGLLELPGASQLKLPASAASAAEAAAGRLGRRMGMTAAPAAAKAASVAASRSAAR